MRFVVCSFNRGAFLRHCVDTIERCAPDHPLTVIDDASDDPETLQALEAIARRHEVVTSTSLSDHKHGGLYENMQAALDRSPEELLCFLQDDTQLVRALEPRDEVELRQAFAAREDLAFVSPCFIRGIALKHRQDRDFRFDTATGLWYWHPQKRSTGAHYSDVVIAHRPRLREAGWRFLAGESANDRQAAERFTRMGHMHLPFAMWLPNVPTYRGKRKTLALRWAERRRGCGMHRLRLLNAGEIATLREETRAGGRLPLAESMLEPEGGRLAEPWRFDPLQGSPLLKNLNRLELALSRRR